jgi:hypothetical protein
MNITNTTTGELVKAFQQQQIEIQKIREMMRLQIEFNEGMVKGYEQVMAFSLIQSVAIVVLIIALFIVSKLYIRMRNGIRKEYEV